MKTSMRPDRLAWALAFAAVSAAAQLVPANPDWKEVDVPPPPAFRLQGLIPLDLPGSTLRFGVDATSVTLGADGIVRYVVVASSPTGTVNAMYEGLRCGTAEVKTYARHNPDSGWAPVESPQWRPLHGNSQSRHSLIIARTGACVGQGPNRSAATIVKDLRSPVDSRFSNEVR
jgi:hypothetical protein